MQAEIHKEVSTLIGLKLKEEVLSEWFVVMQTLPNLDFQNKKSILKATINFIFQKGVSLNAISEKVEINLTPINNEFQVSIFIFLDLTLKGFSARPTKNF